ncbi:MAG: hypothetical protein LAO05_05150 [Acidobacteriia bacterium]|nr:hypothetical protein [Terriglobia bacterium]
MARDTIGRRAGLAGAVICLVLGVLQAALISTPTARRTPNVSDLLAPLASAPVPRGAAIALSMPPAVGRERSLPILYEAAWQRPDLRWTLDENDARAAFVAVLPGGRVPAGFSKIWHAGNLVVFRRAGH